MEINSRARTEWYLREWGRWAYHRRGLSLSYPSIEPYTRMRGSVVPEPMISDDEGCGVDKVVAMLLQENPMEGEAVALYYLDGRAYKRLMRKWRVDRSELARILDAGTRWIDDHIHG